ncbi:MAG: YlbF family regulator [Clostridiales bacterium]|nr:YlbF family regulator [Clostridiales bacterium]MCD8215662.1 YlbF family regulator [Clostridiales bacterium]
MEESFDKARELGALMLKSPLAIRLEAAREAFDNDMEARETLFDYNRKNRRVEELMSKDASGEEFKAANEELREALEKLRADKVIEELITCESRFNNYVNQVLNIVKATVLGDEGCTGNCSGCAGCH